MPKLKVIFTQETIISRKEIIQIEYSPESRITSSRPSKKADENVGLFILHENEKKVKQQKSAPLARNA